MNTHVSSFWQRWLLVALVFYFGMGISITYWIDSFVWQWHQNSVAQSLWGEGSFSEETLAYRSWVMSIFGPTFCAWAVALLYVVKKPFAAGEPWAWNCLAISLVVWFVPDTLWSLSHEVWANVVFNVLGFGTIGIPLIATRSSFFGVKSESDAAEGVKVE